MVESRFIITTQAGKTNYATLMEGAVGVGLGYIAADAFDALLSVATKKESGFINLIGDAIMGLAEYFVIPNPQWGLTTALGSFGKFITDLVAMMLKGTVGSKVKAYASGIASSGVGVIRKYEAVNVLPRKEEVSSTGQTAVVPTM